MIAANLRNPHGSSSGTTAYTVHRVLRTRTPQKRVHNTALNPSTSPQRTRPTQYSLQQKSKKTSENVEINKERQEHTEHFERKKPKSPILDFRFPISDHSPWPQAVSQKLHPLRHIITITLSYTKNLTLGKSSQHRSRVEASASTPPAPTF